MNHGLVPCCWLLIGLTACDQGARTQDTGGGTTDQAVDLRAPDGAGPDRTADRAVDRIIGEPSPSLSKLLRKEILADSPSGYWPLDEGGGFWAHDHAGKNRHGGYKGTCKLGQPGLAGNAVDFGGTCHVPVPHPMTVFMSASAGSVTALVRLPQTYTKATTKWPSHTLPVVFAIHGYYLGLSAGSFAGTAGLHIWNFHSGSQFDSVSAAATPGSWAHVAWVHDGAKLTLYVNGTGSSAASHGATAKMGVLRIGCCGGDADNRYPGLIQHVAVFPTALTAARVKAHAAAVGLAPQ